jgi:hypothetical protein
LTNKTEAKIRTPIPRTVSKAPKILLRIIAISISADHFHESKIALIQLHNSGKELYHSHLQPIFYKLKETIAWATVSFRNED